MSDIGLPNLNKTLRESTEKAQEALKEKARKEEEFKCRLLEELRTVNKKLDEIITLLKSK